MANEYGQYFADKARFLCPASVFVCACRWNITLLYSRIIHAHSIFFHQHLPQRNTGRKVLVGGEWRQRRENNDFTLWEKKKVLLYEIFCSSEKKVIIEEWDGLGIEGEVIEGITFLTVLWEKRNLIKQNTKSWRSLYEVCVTWLVLRLWLERQLPLGAVANVK